jgi:LysR family transcriptional regulator, glycine cleavage system transcriptional activator
MRRLPSLNGLRAFEAVTRHLNFRLAAQELGVTQGAVAQQIRALEAELGMKLFERRPRTLVPTEAGHSYAPNIRRAFEMMQEATEALRPQGKQITISVTPTFASKWLIPRLPDLTDAHPDIDLRIVATDRIADFQTDGVDLAVRLGRPPFGADLNADLLFRQVVVAVGSPLLIEKLGRPEESDNLSRYPLLHDAHNLWPRFLESIGSAGASLEKKNIRFNQTALAIDAAIAGQGLALASSLFVQDNLTSGRLIRLFGEGLRLGLDFYVVAPCRPRHAQSVKKVTEWLSRASRTMGQSGSNTSLRRDSSATRVPASSRSMRRL